MWNIDEFLSGLNIDLDRLRDVFTYDPQAPMIFSSGIFLWLFVAFILVYLLLQRRTTARLLFVTLFSYYFYYKSSGTYFFLLGLVTVCDFFIARLMAREAIPWLRKAWVVLSLFINLGLLCYFKYTNFLGETFASLTGGTFTTMDIFLPVGISFFTFQSLSYTIDVYRRQITPLTSLLDYAFYVSFFPQLVAGPIVRARDFIPQIRRPLFVSNEMFGRGIFLIVSGLFKKAVISDYISVNFVERIFDNPTLYSGVENLIGVYGYALQIYCDFSGYSDMAIGIALLLGFHFNINFDSPYKSASITEFWRRWHISLSSWLRDYLYISLGGNRKGTLRTVRNLAVVWVLTGLWHGASWNFVLWGLYYFVFLAIEKLFLGQLLEKLPAVVGHAYALFIIVVGWVFFYFDDVSRLGQMLKLMFGFSGQAGVLPTDTVLLKNHLVFFLVAIIACIPVSKLVKALLIRFSRKGPVQESLAGAAGILYDVALLFFSTAALVGASYNPFLYFRF